MEYNNNNDNRVGGGIIAVAVLHFIGNAFVILGGILLLGSSNVLKSIAPDYDFSSTEIIFSSIVLPIALIISLIFLLNKKKAGVIAYYAIILINLIYSLISSGFNILTILFALLLPVIMGILIAQKKEVFGF